MPPKPSTFSARQIADLAQKLSELYYLPQQAKGPLYRHLDDLAHALAKRPELIRVSPSGRIPHTPNGNKQPVQTFLVTSPFDSYLFTAMQKHGIIECPPGQAPILSDKFSNEVTKGEPILCLHRALKRGGWTNVALFASQAAADDRQVVAHTVELALPSEHPLDPLKQRTIYEIVSKPLALRLADDPELRDLIAQTIAAQPEDERFLAQCGFDRDQIESMKKVQTWVSQANLIAALRNGQNHGDVPGSFFA